MPEPIYIKHSLKNATLKNTPLKTNKQFRPNYSASVES